MCSYCAWQQISAAGLGGVSWGGGGGWGGEGLRRYTYFYCTITGDGVGLDRVQTDSRFDFLSFFSNDDDENSVPDSFFTNNHCSPYSNINLGCKYVEVDKLCDLDQDKFTVLSLNIQSLPAKYVEFSDLINEFAVSSSCPDIICIQETWKIVDTSLFPLNDYHPLEINQRNIARGGGVGH